MKIWAEDFEPKAIAQYSVPFASYSRRACEQWVARQDYPESYSIWGHNGAYDVRRYATDLEIEADQRDWELDAARYEFEQYMEYQQ